MTTDPGGAPIELNTHLPHPARIYDYLLGGKTNFAADREMAELALSHMPELQVGARANRRFMVRAVRFLAGTGVRQFVDIGAGVPTSPNVHEVAQAVAPDARVVYVDNDPIVLVHGRALLAGPGPGATAVVHADLRDTVALLGHPELTNVIDFDQPVAILLVAVLHLILDADDPGGIVARMMEPAAPGSYLVLSHGARDLNEERGAALRKAISSHGTLSARRHEEVLRFFDGLDLVEPGLVQLPRWRPDGEVEEGSDNVALWAGVARKG